MSEPFASIPAKVQIPPDAPTPAFKDEPFVQVGESDKVFVRMQYPLLGRENATQRCLLRECAFERLQQAAASLPAGIALVVWDAWRSFALQQELYETYREHIVKQFSLDRLPAEEREQAINRFVALPRADCDAPPAHTTGGAVDVTLADAQGNYLPMGTAFDAFVEEAATASYELACPAGADAMEWEQVRRNRRMLYAAMTAAGFTNLESEWWHYDFGNRNWSLRCGQAARYRGAFTEEELADAGVL